MSADAVVDTCCLVNVCAAGEPLFLLRATPYQWHVPRAVSAETLYLREVDASGKSLQRKLDLDACFAANVLRACDVTNPEEAELYVTFAQDLDDGEAMALAIAKARCFMLATDEKKARRFAESHSVPVVTTPEIMRRWAEDNAVEETLVRQALLGIQSKARFIPTSSFPDYDWWMKVVA